ncbi:response regulator [Curtobacterium sp. SGAir0471]|uniref:response regulator n=1 Tax=Curtobacterium sp. SGAir0471 TaxID=2070337 RepID=UPI0015863B60|nr:response regulator transcription factor [Curtobacterium sp. SGAir0471]
MIRVLIVDDDHEVRASLRVLLEADPGIVVVAECSDGERAVTTARRLRADVAVVDLRMPGIDGVETTERLLAETPTERVLVLTAFEHDDAVLRALAAGASGFLLKGSRPRELAAAVHDVVAGRCVLAPAVTTAVVARAVLRDQERPPEPVDDLVDLTERERELAVAVGEGLTNAQIAARLGVTPSSAKTFVSRLLEKLGLQNRTQLAIAAHRAGLV